MINDIQRRILAEAAKFGGSDVSSAQIIANNLNEAQLQSWMSGGGVVGIAAANLGFSKAQFEGKMRQLLMKMGFEKGINKMDINGNKMVLYFANRAKANDFVITFNGLVKRSSKGSPATLSTSFDKIKSPAGTNAVVTVDFSMMKTEDLENGSDVFVMLEALYENSIEEATESSIAEFIIGPSNKTNYVKVTKHPTNKNALLVTSGGSPRQISKSDFMSFINSYDKTNPKGKEHYSVDFEDGTYDFKIGETWQKLFLGNSISPTARFTRTYPKTYSYPDWLKAISKSAMKEEVEIEEAKKSPIYSVPAGASEKEFAKARAANPHRVRLLHPGKPAGAPANKVKEDIEESASKAALEDFMYDLPKAAIEELRPVMKMKQGVGRMAKITAVLKKHGITQKFMGAFPTSVVNDYFDTFHGESVEENGEKIDEQSVARRLGQTIGALRHGKPTPKDRLDDLTRDRKRRDHWQKLQKDPTFLAQNAYAKKQEQDEIKRQIAHLQTFLTKEEVESVEEALAPSAAEANIVIGHFIEKSKGNRFEYRKSQSDWGKKHGYPHEVWVSSGKTRSANVKGTVCYIVTDEDGEGKPVVDKWMIKSHFKYVKAD